MVFFPFPNPPHSSQNASINMIYNNIIEKGKSIADESTSLTHFEEIYNAIQSTSDPTINDHLLMALDRYHLLYWLDNTRHL